MFILKNVYLKSFIPLNFQQTKCRKLNSSWNEKNHLGHPESELSMIPLKVAATFILKNGNAKIFILTTISTHIVATAT